jgi:hypothetical protein
VAFEYYLLSQCQIQSKRTPTEFMRRVKIGGLVAQVPVAHEQQGKDPASLPEQKIVLPYFIPTLLGEKKELTYRELSDTWSRIERKSHRHCGSCSANVRESVMGCYGAIRYPITAGGEEWLMRRLGSEPGYVHHHAANAGVTGRDWDARRGTVRQNFIPFMERENTYVHRYGDGETLTLGQVMEYLSVCGTLRPPTLLGLLMDFNAIDLDVATGFALNAMMSMGGAEHGGAMLKEKARFTLQVEDSDCRGTVDFKGFLHACWIAATTGHQVLVDG